MRVFDLHGHGAIRANYAFRSKLLRNPQLDPMIPSSNIICCLLVFALGHPQGFAQTVSRERIVESIVPWLTHNSSCWSGVAVKNLGDREVTAEVEAHKSSGALAPFTSPAGIRVRFAPGERVEFKPQLEEDATGAWVRVREVVALPQQSPVLAVSGATECLSGDELRATVREVAWPSANPWFSADVIRGDDGILALINASERPAEVSICYSSGVFYSVPRNDRPEVELTPLCSKTVHELIPPFGSRQFPVAHDNNSHCRLTTRGGAIVLQMLRPAGTSVKMYRVDSTITFGKEASGK